MCSEDREAFHPYVLHRMGKMWNLILHVKLWSGSWGTAQAAASSFTSHFQAAPATASEGSALVMG